MGYPLPFLRSGENYEMRKIIFMAIVLIVLGTAWTLYLKHDTERFIDSLPKKSATGTQPQNITNMPVTDENSDPFQSMNVIEGALEDFNEEPGAAGSAEGGNSEKKDTSGLIDFANEFLERDPIAEWSPHPAEEEHPAEEPMGLMKLSRAEIVENNRKRLIEIHGDIPEVHTYLKYFPFEALQNPENTGTYSFTMSLDEFLEYQKASAVLFPNASNIKNYQQALEMYEKFKGDDSQKH